MPQWDKSRIALAKRALAKSETLREAGKRLGNCDGSAIVQAFARAGMPEAASFLRRRPAETLREIADRRDVDAELRALRRSLTEQERAAHFWSRLPAVAAVTIQRSAPKRGKREAIPVSVASDWHVGETVESDETNGRNVYNLVEARRRAANYWDNVLWLRKRGQEVTTSRDHVQILGGDMISGSIHPELLETNEVGLADQVSAAAEMILPGIRALAAVTRRLIIPCVSGNHARVTEKSRIKTGWSNSLETMLYRQLVAETRDLKNVEWLIPRAEQILFDVMGYRLHIQHGTQIKSQGGIGGILVPLNRFATRCADAQYYIFGHFHQACWFDQVIVNGSLIGDSAYSRANGLPFRPPEQVCFELDAKRGLRTFNPTSVT